MNSVITVYLLIAGLADNILKPVLLGRGVNVPMPVILIGALGGMVGMGLIGLFLGSVVLAVGYQLLWAWVDHDKARTETEATTTFTENPN
jgi:predicted PurR-regulated permease PerM